MARTSVIVPIYNTENFLNRCLTSLKNQTEEDIEFILVDDASTDNSLKIMETYEKDARFKLYSFPINQGVSCARNFALSKATGKYIGFVDSDDYVDENYFEVLREHLEDEKVPISVAGIRQAMELPLKPQRVDFRNPKTPLQMGTICVWSHLFDRNLMFNEQFLEHTRFEDTAFTLLMHMKGEKLSITNDTFYHYKGDNPSCYGRTGAKELSSILDRMKVADYLDKLGREEQYLHYQERLKTTEILFLLSSVHTIIQSGTLEEQEDLISLLDIYTKKKYGDYEQLIDKTTFNYLIGPFYQDYLSKEKQELYNQFNVQTCEFFIRQKVKSKKEQ